MLDAGRALRDRPVRARSSKREAKVQLCRFFSWEWLWACFDPEEVGVSVPVAIALPGGLQFGVSGFSSSETEQQHRGKNQRPVFSFSNGSREFQESLRWRAEAWPNRTSTNGFSQDFPHLPQF